MKTQLLYPFANVQGIFFPIFKPINGGTCEFATEKCLKMCCANDEDIGANIQQRIETYRFFIENTVSAITIRLIGETTAPASSVPKFISWFASGDCPATYTDKIFEIIRRMKDTGIIQSGTTRNHKLWEMLLNIQDDKTRFLYTTEFPPVFSREGGMYAIPKYDIGCMDIITTVGSKQRRDYGCGGGYYFQHIMKEKPVKSEKYLQLDCKKCYQQKTGCFIKL